MTKAENEKELQKQKLVRNGFMGGFSIISIAHAVDMLNAAFEIRNYMLQRKKEKVSRGEIPFELRIGIHTGPVVAGIVGVKKYANDIWGDIVNVAARTLKVNQRVVHLINTASN